MKVLFFLASILILSVGIQKTFAEESSLILNSGNFTFMKNHYGFNIPYEITNGTIQEIKMDCGSKILLVEIISNRDGALRIDIPTVLMNPFTFVSVDYDLPKSYDFNGDTATIPFSKDSKQIRLSGGGSMHPNPSSCQQVDNPPHSFLLSPIKQMKNGIAPNNIICKENLALIYKYSELFPSCVKSSSVQKLIERGWAESFKYKILNNSKITDEIKNSILSENAVAGFLGNPCDSKEKGCIVRIEIFNETDTNNLPPLLMELGFGQKSALARLTFQEIQIISEFPEVKKISSGQSLR